MAQFKKILKFTQAKITPENPAFLLLQQSLNKIQDILHGRILPGLQYKHTGYSLKIGEILEENSSFKLELRNSKIKSYEDDMQIEFLKQQMHDLNDEVQMYQSKYEAIKEENRQLNNQKRIQRNEVSNAVAYSKLIEKDRERMINEIYRIYGRTDKIQNLLSESFLNQSK